MSTGSTSSGSSASPLRVTDYLQATREALAAFVDAAHHAGLDTPVPTTPGWTVLDLVAHQGMVHRWARATIRGERVNDASLEHQGLTNGDPVGWLHTGGLELLETLDDAPADLEAPTFLADAPAARVFWARRQCHETTIHAVDALGAQLGRAPKAAETWVSHDVAADGVDELLTGFLPRPRSKVIMKQPVSLIVDALDVDRHWLVRVSDQTPVVEREPEHHQADSRLRAPARELYMGLWNRSTELAIPDWWRKKAVIRW